MIFWRPISSRILESWSISSIKLETTDSIKKSRYQESLFWVPNQVVKVRFFKTLLVLIFFPEVQELWLEDHSNLDLCTQIKVLLLWGRKGRWKTLRNFWKWYFRQNIYKFWRCTSSYWKIDRLGSREKRINCWWSNQVKNLLKRLSRFDYDRSAWYHKNRHSWSERYLESYNRDGS